MSTPDHRPGPSDTSRTLTMVQAIREALRQAMEAMPTVIVLGEDVAGGAGLGPPREGSMGGTFGATKGLLEEFGPARVRDTPISEAGFTGTAIGAAAAGLRPVVDLMWSSFAPLAFDQILNQAAKMRYMFGGQATVPVVFRMAMGAGLGAAGQHSDTLYSLFTHIPGLKVVTPATPSDAKGLLISAIRDDNPVIFLEHMALYNNREPVPNEIFEIPIGQARLARPGSDVTIVGCARMVERSLQAADSLAADEIDAEVLDLRSLSPLDEDAICSSVARTHRLVIADESPPRCSLATDVAAMVADKAFDCLRAPIKRVTSPHCPVPLSPPLETAYIPAADTIASVAASLVRLPSERAETRPFLAQP
jgi:acetoin:2,6-dichlorophenolindophenol oxidoreductase subunit beta